MYTATSTCTGTSLTPESLQKTVDYLKGGEYMADITRYESTLAPCKSYYEEGLLKENRYLREKLEYYQRRFDEEREYQYRRMYMVDPWMSGGWLEVEKPKPMKLKTLAKKILDADTRALIKAGIIGEDLELTNDGIKFVLSQYLLENKTSVAKEARKKLKEDKEESEE